MAISAKKKPSLDKINLETRLLATFSLMELCKTDADNINAADFEDLYTKVAGLNDRVFEDEEAMRLVTEHELDEVSNIDQLKEKIRRNRAVSAYKELGFFGLSSGAMNERIPEAPEVLATIMHNIGIKDADALSEAAVTGQLDDQSAEKLFKELNTRQGALKKILTQDFQTYKDQKFQNPVIQQVYNDIEEYTFEKNRSIEYPFEVRKQQRDFRLAVRQNFNNVTKPDFLKLYGTMLTEGKNIAQQSSLNSSYTRFCNMVADNVGEQQAKSEIDLMLNISPEEAQQSGIETKRKQAYQEKCSELYFKTVAGILSEKYNYNQKHNISCDYDIYLRTINDTYIRGLCNGVNDIGSLAFQDADYSKGFTSKADEHKLNKEMRDETADQQIISIHHKFPIGAVYDIHDKLHDKATEQEKIANCCQLVNNNSNMVYVIGQEKHQSLEATNAMKFGANQNAMIFAARINCAGLRNVMSKLPKNTREGLQKYVKMADGEKTKDISVNMKFSEPKEISSLRETLQSENNHVNIADKFARYYANDGK